MHAEACEVRAEALCHLRLAQRCGTRLAWLSRTHFDGSLGLEGNSLSLRGISSSSALSDRP